ncbi:MAG: hypothetical protein PHU85_04770 [Phycisphaerae bacterium]|nr:hypothetical protein [Phycisphaerae bacterium]
MSTHRKSARPDYSNLVTADEMLDSRAWLASVLSALGAGRIASGCR